MDAKRQGGIGGGTALEETAGALRAHMAPVAAALVAGLLIAFAETPATAQSQSQPMPTSGVIASGAPTGAPATTDDAAPVDPIPAVMAPGDYEWNPERSLAGDVVVVVSLPQQVVHVYRGGVRIGRSTISSGREGHETPTGVFTILQKQKMHRSTLYDDAPMPFMQRLTWDGIALHAGRLPGYPASHGCVRLPKAFAELLYDVTDHGGVVVVADDASFASDIVRPGDQASADLMAIAANPAMGDDGERVLAAGDAPSAAPAAQGTGSAAAM